MNQLSEANQAIILAYQKGYRVLNNQVFNPKGNLIKGYISTRTRRFNYKIHSFSFIYNDKTVHIRTSRFVAYQKFGNKIFDTTLQVRHLDSNSLNNNEYNIGLGTGSENCMDKISEIRMKTAINASSKIRKFSDAIVAEIKEKNKNGVSYNKLMKEYNISSKGTISFLINNTYVTKVE